MKKKNKIIAITLSIVVGAVALLSSIPLIFRSVNGVKGTKAAKILLARENMNDANSNFDWKKMFESETAPKLKENTQPSNATFARSGGNVSPIRFFSSNQNSDLGELVHDSPGGKVYKNGGEYVFKDISGASYQGLVVESRLFDIDYRVENAAKNINFLKNQLNIVNKWVKDGNSKFYLDVNSNKETLLEYYEDTHGQKFLWVVERETREDANSVYSLMYTDMGSGKVNNPTFLVYIPNERYEYYYGHEGNSTDYLIAEQDKGYWNVFMPNETDYRNVTISDDFAFHSYGEYNSLGDDYGTVSTVDLKEDIINNYQSGLSIHLSTFNGISGIYASEETCFVDTYDGGEKTYINVNFEDRKKLKIGLNNGEFLSLNDLFTYGENTVEISHVNFEFFSNPGFADVQYDVSINLEMGEGLTLKEKLSLFEEFLTDNGLTCKYSLEDIEKNILKNSVVANSITSFYDWNGNLMSSSENFKKSEKVIFDKIDTMFAEYEKVKDAEEVSRFSLAKVSKRQSFAKISDVTFGKTAYSEGKIQIESVALTVEKSNLLEENTNYKLQIGLARTDKNGKFLSQNTVSLKTVDTVTAKAYSGDDLTLSASGTYDIPTALEENKYVVVVYAVTEDEEIRVSEMKAVAFVDTVSDTFETTSVKININGVDGALIVEYVTKLYFNITVNGETSYALLRRRMMAEVLKNGYPVENEEITDKNGNAVVDGEILPGEYKLKFAISTIDGVVSGYVVCVVTAT